jgi:hypothetical protein
MMPTSLEGENVAGAASGKNLVRTASGDDGVLDAWRTGYHRVIGIEADHELRLGRIGRGDVAGVTLRAIKASA